MAVWERYSFLMAASLISYLTWKTARDEGEESTIYEDTHTPVASPSSEDGLTKSSVTRRSKRDKRDSVVKKTFKDDVEVGGNGDNELLIESQIRGKDEIM